MESVLAYNQNINFFYDFNAKTIDGETINLSQFKRIKVLVVNTVSKCRFTKQYKQLEELYIKHSGNNFTIIGFPSNDFLSQEPGTNSEIKEFCMKNYGVTFPMIEKISVKGGNIHPLYQCLTRKSENRLMDAKVKWNFQKFIIDESGHLVGVISPGES